LLCKYVTISFCIGLLVITLLTNTASISREDHEIQKTMSLVVAHCNEDLDWIHLLYKHFNIKILLYEKCFNESKILRFKEKNPLARVTQIQLENIGRDMHTFIYHILYQQQEFANINIFLQGEKECNNRDILTEISTIENNYKTIPYWASLKFEECPFVPHFNFNVENEYRYCDWFSKVTHISDFNKCINSQASYRGEMIANRAALENVRSKHYQVLVDLLKALAEETEATKYVHLYYVERLWTVLFKGYQYRNCSKSIGPLRTHPRWMKTKHR